MAKLKYIYSVMNAGKSTHLLQVDHNYQTFDSNVLLYTHSVDKRFGEKKITSRLGISKDAKAVDKDTNLYVDIKNNHKHKPVSCVLVDESQFFTMKQIYQLSDVVDYLNIPVICYGIKTDAFGELFEGSRTLLEIADNIDEIKQLCFCGKKATMIRRFDSEGNVLKDGSQTSIGAEEKYISLCRKHWKVLEHRDDIKNYKYIVRH